MTSVSERCSGRYGGELPATVKGLAKAYLADYDRRSEIVLNGEARDGDKQRFKRINSIIDACIASVLNMYGIYGKAAEIVMRDLKSGEGARSVRCVSMVGAFLSRKGYEHVRDDVLWFVAQELRLF